MSTVDGLLDFEATQGERLVITKTLYGADGNPADLTGLTVKFSLRPRGKTSATINRAACAVVGLATAGTVKYTSAADALAAVSGFVEAQFVTLDGSAPPIPQYFPDGKDEYLLGYITPAIA
jgi:hypothetical protein